MKLIIKKPIHYVFTYEKATPAAEIQRIIAYYLNIEQVLHQFKIYGHTALDDAGVFVSIEPQVVSMNEYNMQTFLSKALSDLGLFRLAYTPEVSTYGEMAFELVDFELRDTAQGDAAF